MEVERKLKYFTYFLKIITKKLVFLKKMKYLCNVRKINKI